MFKSVKFWSIAFVIGIVIGVVIWYNVGNRIPTDYMIVPTQIPIDTINDWKSNISVSGQDTLHIVKVTYQEKYGSEKVAYCNVVFENAKTAQYKCMAPGLVLVLEKSNLISFKSEIISKKDM